ncbi:TusE/DsrC/DsvC family sulfur relay protein [Thiotrichales bacterium 19S3-7]|nr:TusE/DsrC/DsvC family sulfur relay protein [Thiotrichales bacterium 19S3-7]MCF6801890.1 TusE/DsrC/DsvC family sulfur relay protein [Thiotrichales bacterium 19S3-11]
MILTNYPTDNDGFLLDLSCWDEKFAQITAENENIQLSQAHWEVIYFLRSFYQKHQTSPAIRALIKALKLKFGDQKGNSLYLQSLFPESPALQAAKIAGLPKPAKCI